MNPAVLFLFLLSAPVAGCALRSGAQAGEEPRSRVDMALADASDSITRDLAILTGGNRVTAPAVPGGSLAEMCIRDRAGAGRRCSGSGNWRKVPFPRPR